MFTNLDPEELRRIQREIAARFDEAFNRYILDYFAHDARPKPYTEEQAKQAEIHERIIRDAEIDGGE